MLSNSTFITVMSFNVVKCEFRTYFDLAKIWANTPPPLENSSYFLQTTNPIIGVVSLLAGSC
jgi:hypothetical protein